MLPDPTVETPLLEARVATLEAALQTVQGDLALLSWLYAEMVFEVKKAIVAAAMNDPALRQRLVEQLAARA